MKPRLLDLMCGAGGAAKGYQRAGFYVVGVDHRPMPNYCGDAFYCADALELLRDLLDGGTLEDGGLGDFAAIHASPPCQGYSIAANNGSGLNVPRLIAPVRKLLEATGLPFSIENVCGARAHMRAPVMICGASFGLGIPDWDLARHRLFECSFPVMVHPCAHRRGSTIGVYGHGTNAWHREKLGRNLREAEKREAMGIDWMTRAELAEAIPPAYCEHIGSYLMTHLTTRAAA